MYKYTKGLYALITFLFIVDGPKYEELDIFIYVFIALCAYFLVQKPLFLELQILKRAEHGIEIET